MLSEWETFLIFKKWSRDFRPVKEHFEEIPLWIKLSNLPLCCWHKKGFSKISSKFGVSLAIDFLTASKSCITFARICVQLSPSATLPDEISLNLNSSCNLNSSSWKQQISYDWKPKPYSACCTFSHEPSSCPKNPRDTFPNRGHSRSRPPRPRMRR